jgi:hypothetical protein
VQKFLDSLEGYACRSPLLDEKDLLQVPCPISGSASLPIGLVNEACLDVIAKGANRQVSQDAKVVKREFLDGF